MSTAECKAFIKDFFEKYYAKLLGKDVFFVKLCDVPEEMWADGAEPDEEEWVQWKLIPSTIGDDDIKQLENDWGIEFPEIMKCFLTTYFHYFEDPIGRNPSDEPFYALNNAWNPVLVKAGYLPFAWDREHYFIRCLDLVNMPDEDKCAVCQIDHEVLFDFEEEGVSREEIRGKMEVLADNFKAYLEDLIEEEI